PSMWYDNRFGRSNRSNTSAKGSRFTSTDTSIVGLTKRSLYIIRYPVCFSSVASTSVNGLLSAFRVTVWESEAALTCSEAHSNKNDISFIMRHNWWLFPADGKTRHTGNS